MHMKDRESLKLVAGIFAAAAALLSPAALQAQSDGAGVTVSHQAAGVEEDIGVIEEVGSAANAAPSPSKFRMSVSTQSQYTSNALLSGSRSSSDFIFIPAVNAGYNLPLKHGFTLDLSAQIDSAVYASNDDRSFSAYSAQTTLDWRYKKDWPRIYVDAEPYRFDSFDSGGLITQAIGTGVGTDWGFAFNRNSSLFFVGSSFSHYFADPNVDSRSVGRAIVGVTQQIRQQVYAQVYYQYQYSSFDNISRNDSRNVLGLSVTWQLNKHLFTSINGSFINNLSTETNAPYKSANIGWGLNWQF